MNKYHKEYILSPWLKHYASAQNRCRLCYVGHNKHLYKNIKFLLTPEEIKYLWFRDKAMNLKRVSIDRINPRGDYTLENCRFIELSENSRLGGRVGGKIMTPKRLAVLRKTIKKAYQTRRTR